MRRMPVFVFRGLWQEPGHQWPGRQISSDGTAALRRQVLPVVGSGQCRRPASGRHAVHLGELGNDTEIKVHQMHNVLSASSHHLIVYQGQHGHDRADHADAVPAVHRRAQHDRHDLRRSMITQKHDDEITLPDGVAYTFAPHQMMKLEMHYINCDDAAEMAQATVDIFAADPTTIHDEAATSCSPARPTSAIPPNTTADTPSVLHPCRARSTSASRDSSSRSPATSTSSAPTCIVSVAPSKTGPMTEVGLRPDAVPVERARDRGLHNAGFSVPTGAASTSRALEQHQPPPTVSFGESANDEMCFCVGVLLPVAGHPGVLPHEQVGAPQHLLPGMPAACAARSRSKPLRPGSRADAADDDRRDLVAAEEVVPLDVRACRASTDRAAPPTPRTAAADRAGRATAAPAPRELAHPRPPLGSASNVPDISTSPAGGAFACAARRRAPASRPARTRRARAASR